MPTWSRTSPPTWFPSAIATDRGWVCPKTGELLVSCNSLIDTSSHKDMLLTKSTKRRGRPRKKVVEFETIEPTEDFVESVEKPTTNTKRRGRKAKNANT